MSSTMRTRGLAVVAMVLVLGVGAGAQVGDSGDVVNPNLAGADELRKLPHLMGPIVDGLMDFVPRIHDKRALPHDRFTKWLTRQDEQSRCQLSFQHHDTPDV